MKPTWRQLAAIERQRQREYERAKREWERAEAKRRKEQYLTDRKGEAEARTRAIAQQLVDLETLLVGALGRQPPAVFDGLLPREQFRPPALPPIARPSPPIRDEYFRGIATEPGLLERLFGFGREGREAALARAERTYEAAEQEYQRACAQADQQKVQQQTAVKRAHAEWEQEMARQRDEVAAFQAAYVAGDPGAVQAYCAMVLESSAYPDGFPKQFNVAYNGDSRELVVQYQVPGLDVVPEVREYRYVQTGDRFTEVPMKAKDRKAIYERALAQTALRTLHEVFTADYSAHVESAVFNGVVRGTDPRTGKDIGPCLVTVQSTRDQFMGLDLGRVEPIACLKGLRAHVSPGADELAPVKPIVEFNMLDKRFVQEEDVLSELDDRTNIYEMNPFDFEHLICNLFTKIGLETRLTRASRDGGIDVVAFDPRPVFGGKYVIQAKRYRNTVEVAAVRDLYGSMMNENAAKGILVTTSSFGPDARAFAKDKPIELIDGASLLYLLAEQGIQAKILFSA